MGSKLVTQKCYRKTYWIDKLKSSIMAWSALSWALLSSPDKKHNNVWETSTEMPTYIQN